MLAQIASKLFDLDGYAALELLPDSTAETLSRRFSKVSTLDGGVAVNDRGFSHGDREFTLAYANQTAAIDATLSRLVRLHSRVYLSIGNEFFECAPVAHNANAGRPTITLSVIERIAGE